MSAANEPDAQPFHTSGFMAIVQPQGWQCPGCNRCFAPSVTKCDSCGPPTYTTNGTVETGLFMQCETHGWTFTPETKCPVCAGEITG